LLPDDLREATRLTKAGRLIEATASIQRLLTRGPDKRPDEKTVTIDAAEDAVTAMAQVKERAGGSSILAQLRGLFGTRRPAPREPVKEGISQYLSRQFRAGAEGRPYKLYVPSGYQGRAVPLVIMLHGCKQSADDFAAGTGMNISGEKHTCIIAYPEQVRSANAQKCWNWFSESDQRGAAGEASLIAGITREVMRDYAINARRVYVAGLSAGGATAAIMAATYPGLYAAFGVHSGLAYGAAKDLRSGLAAMRTGGSGDQKHFDPDARVVPAIVFHGDRDPVVNPLNANQVVAQATREIPLTIRTECGHSGGRGYTRRLFVDDSGRTVAEQWTIHGASHAWSGGNSKGTFTDPSGPDATREILRFFLEHQIPEVEVSTLG
jgi:poly(hydroxyalkanoate) depolymerase family esterase